MPTRQPQPSRTPVTFAGAVLLAVLPWALLSGCASPGPPRPPSLGLPQPARDLSAARVGDSVNLTFTLARRSSDNLPLRDPAVALHICREVVPGPCTPIVAGPARVEFASLRGPLTVTDTLPASLAGGPPRLLAYRIEVLNASGRSAGPTAPAFAAAGTAPPPVAGLSAQGSRLGIVLRWAGAPPDGSQVLLRRAPVSPVAGKPGTPATLRVAGGPAAQAKDSVLDTAAAESTPYTYTAWRERTVKLGDRTLTLRSPESNPVAFTLHDTFAPPAPTDLVATAFPVAAGDGIAVDLIWQPVEDPELAGYLVYRTAPGEAPQKLNASPLRTPAFHDTTAQPGIAYRYTVSAIDTHGNESPAASYTLTVH